jgi:hypothetical protein
MLPREFVALANEWCGELSYRVLDLIWRGYVRLRRDNPSTMNKADEREVTQHLVWRIRAAMSGFEPYECEHKPNIEESQHSPNAQPPEPDLGFIMHCDERVIWPVEAKILHQPSDVAAYVAEVQDNFVTGRYTALSDQGALLGYMLRGKPNAAFLHLENALACSLEPHPAFPRRPQRISQHRSIYVAGRSPANFPVGKAIACHHFMFPL